MPDPSQPDSPANKTVQPDAAAAPQPSEADVVKALVEIEHATQQAETRVPPPPPAAQESWFTGRAFGIFYVGLVLAVCLSLGWVAHRLVKSISLMPFTQIRRSNTGAAISHPVDPTLQVQAEALLKRLASRDPAAADQVLSQSDTWTGKTQRTQLTDQLLTTAINLPDLRAREAALQSQLALDGIPRDATGLSLLEQAVGNPNQRPWALWSLGALGNRGVDPVHTAKIIESYLDDPNPNVRAEAVDGLSLIATDETLPMLLDRFRNDPSPIVQEHAACAMAESGMYTHAQRMRAAASLIGWIDDPLLTAQQRTWSFQALHDITGASLGSDPAAWRSWWSEHPQP